MKNTNVDLSPSFSFIVRNQTSAWTLRIPAQCSHKTRFAAYWELWREPFEKAGIVHWKVRVAGKQVVRGVTPEDMRDFEKIDTTFVWTKFPTKTDVLTIHGLTDILVPP